MIPTPGNPASQGGGEPEVALVVPVFDEAESLPALHAEIAAAMAGTGLAWEVNYVDDRSEDRSLPVLLDLQRLDPHVRVIRLRAHSGQTAALAAGFDHSRGRVVVTLDADLQNDPADIPILLAELGRGADVVAGWRRERRDPFLRLLPSLVANRLIALVTGVRIHDTGCTLKAFRREVIERLPIYAEQHRFLPVLSKRSGARIAEVVVHHRPRRYGSSKYGLGRATRVLLDLLAVQMLSSFSQRPLQYFALLTLPFAALLLWMVGATLADLENLALDYRFGIMAGSIAMTTYFLMLGLVAELAVKASGMHRSGSHGPIGTGLASRTVPGGA